MQSLNCMFSDVKCGKVFKVSEQVQCPAGGQPEKLNTRRKRIKGYISFKVCLMVQCSQNRKMKI